MKHKQGGKIIMVYILVLAFIEQNWTLKAGELFLYNAPVGIFDSKGIFKNICEEIGGIFIYQANPVDTNIKGIWATWSSIGYFIP